MLLFEIIFPLNRVYIDRSSCCCLLRSIHVIGDWLIEEKSPRFYSMKPRNRACSRTRAESGCDVVKLWWWSEYFTRQSQPVSTVLLTKHMHVHQHLLFFLPHLRLFCGSVEETPFTRLLDVPWFCGKVSRMGHLRNEIIWSLGQAFTRKWKQNVISLFTYLHVYVIHI